MKLEEIEGIVAEIEKEKEAAEAAKKKKVGGDLAPVEASSSS